jgi:hypothetical protein
VLTPFCAASVGYWFAGRNDEARDRRAAEREEVARQRARAEALEDERHHFQLNLLLELQDALRVQARTTGEVIRQDLRTLQEMGGLAQLGPDLDQRAYDGGVEFGRLRVRVLDDDLRNQLEDVHSFTSRVTVSAVGLRGLSVPDIKAALEAGSNEMTMRFVQVNDLLGIMLRRELGRSNNAI